MEIEVDGFEGRSGLADFIELFVLSFPKRPLGLAHLRPYFPESWEVDETKIAFLVTELNRRAGILKDRYPFDVKNGAISLARPSHLYSSILALAHHEIVRRKLKLSDLAKSFEILIEGCLSQFFGDSTQTLNFGWPSSIGRPPEFDAAIRWLAARVGIDPGVAYRSPRRRDGGVDVIVWRNFPDGLPGASLMLCQATIQKDFLAKSRDIDRRLWAGWLAMDTDPVIGLAVPFVLENNERWREVARNAVPLDRLRLTLLAPPDFQPQELAVSASVISAIQESCA
jgi:hypothetical protein